ncbi:hypothetical protein BJX64DRAFT_78278 [Aspergillus heterothallicus]
MFSKSTNPSPYYADDRHKALVSLRALSILTSLATFPALAWIIPAHDHVINDGVGSGVTPGVVASTAYAFLWSTIVLILRYIVNISIHPGVYIAFDFLAFGLLAGWTIVMVLFIEPFVDMAYSCRSVDDCDGDLLRKVEWFGGVMGLVCCSVHFLLFVWACWAMDRERKSRRGNKVLPGEESA